MWSERVRGGCCSLETGSVKEGANRDPGMDYGEDDDLHVLITGDTNEEVDRAAEMAGPSPHSYLHNHAPRLVCLYRVVFIVHHQ